MPNETIVFADPGDTVVVKARAASPVAPFDESAHREDLRKYRSFLRIHCEQIGHLLGGGELVDPTKLLMDAEREIPNIPSTLMRSGMTIPEITSLTAIEFRRSKRWCHPDEIAGDMAEALAKLLFKEVDQEIPKK